MTKPTIGRIVHFGDYDLYGNARPRAAIITDVEDSDYINLVVFGSRLMGKEQLVTRVPFSATYQHGHWSWPTRE